MAAEDYDLSKLSDADRAKFHELGQKVGNLALRKIKARQGGDISLMARAVAESEAAKKEFSEFTEKVFSKLQGQ